MTGYLPATLVFFKRFLGPITLASAIDEAGRIKDCPAEFDSFRLEPDLMNGMAQTDFARRLDQTAEDTETLLSKLPSASPPPAAANGPGQPRPLFEPWQRQALAALSGGRKRRGVRPPARGLPPRGCCARMHP